MRSALILIVLALAALPVRAQEPASSWKYRQELQVGKAGLVKVTLPDETLDAARPGLEDLRILDDSGLEIPYLVELVVPEGERMRAARRFRVTLEKEATVIQVECGPGRPVNGVRLETSAAEFIKAVRVEGSLDRVAWQPLVTDEPVFRQPAGENRLLLEFSAGEWPFLRMMLDDSRTGPIPISGIQLRETEEIPSRAPVALKILERIEEPGFTRIDLDLGARHLHLSAIRVQSPDPLFTRKVELRAREVAGHVVQEKPVAFGTIYRVAVEGQAVSENAEIQMDVLIPSREVSLRIQNGESPPIAIDSITALRRPVHVVFLAPRAATYAFLTGNPRSASPGYDLRSMASLLRNARPGTLSLSSRVLNPGYEAAEVFPETRELATPLDVSAWRYRKEVVMPGAAVQQLELDLEVLSRSRRDLGDLRLVRNGAQLPYLRESISVLRPLVPGAADANDPEKPGLSRWVLKLPHSALPIRQLTCRSRTPLFRRHLRLYEMVSDERGSAHEELLGTADWVQEKADPQRSFVLVLGGSPQTDTLILETDNGDNPSLLLNDFVAFYPVTRLLFLSPARDGIFLYYGNETADSLRYDLELAAQQILDAEKSVARLGPEELLREPGWKERASQKAGILFYVALAVVVIVLLFVVSRLLPARP